MFCPRWGTQSILFQGTLWRQGCFKWLFWYSTPRMVFRLLLAVEILLQEAYNDQKYFVNLLIPIIDSLSFKRH